MVWLRVAPLIDHGQWMARAVEPNTSDMRMWRALAALESRTSAWKAKYACQVVRCALYTPKLCCQTPWQPVCWIDESACRRSLHDRAFARGVCRVSWCCVRAHISLQRGCKLTLARVSPSNWGMDEGVHVRLVCMHSICTEQRRRSADSAGATCGKYQNRFELTLKRVLLSRYSEAACVLAHDLCVCKCVCV